jgi:hypothetical protein
MSAIAMGNRVITIPSWKYPLLATDFYQVLDTSDVPGGLANLITGHPDELYYFRPSRCHCGFTAIAPRMALRDRSTSIVRKTM